MRKKVIVSWSGGKDCCMALYRIMRDDKFKVIGLLSSLVKINNEYFVGMHGINEKIIDKQAESFGLDIFKVKFINQQEYEDEISIFLKTQVARGIETIVFGDIYLNELRLQRENKLKEIGMEAVFPLWQNDPLDLTLSFLKMGFKSKIVNVDTKKLDINLLGKDMTESFILKLPKEVDPAGEKGEYHTLTYDGPLFRNKIDISFGSISYADDSMRYAYIETL